MTPSMIKECEQSLRLNWYAFCDCDPLTPVSLDRDRFIEQMEQAKLARLRTVTKADIADDPFASERGIEMGGMVWVLTKAGRTALTSPPSHGGDGRG